MYIYKKIMGARRWFMMSRFYFACLCQLEEDYRYNVWRKTSGCVWLWRGDSFLILKNSHFRWNDWIFTGAAGLFIARSCGP